MSDEQFHGGQQDPYGYGPYPHGSQGDGGEGTAPPEPYGTYGQYGAYDPYDPYGNPAAPYPYAPQSPPQSPPQPQQAYAPYGAPPQEPYQWQGQGQEQQGYPAYQQAAAPQDPQPWAPQPHQGPYREGYQEPYLDHQGRPAHPGPYHQQHGASEPLPYQEQPQHHAHAAVPVQDAPVRHPSGPYAPPQDVPPPEAPLDAPPPAQESAQGAARAPAPRREGSPLIAPGLLPAVLTAVFGMVLACTALLGTAPLTVAVVLLQAVTAAGWFRLNGMWPARQGILLAFLGGVAADAGLLLTGEDKAPAVAIGTLGIWCLLSLVLQLRNRSSADERLYALTAALTSTALTVVAGGYLMAAEASTDVVSAGAAAVGVAALGRALPLPRYVSPAVGLLAAAGAGVAVGRATELGATGGLVGLATGVCALVGLRVASYDWPSRFVHMTAGVALPLALAAPALYVLGRALG